MNNGGGLCAPDFFCHVPNYTLDLTCKGHVRHPMPPFFQLPGSSCNWKGRGETGSCVETNRAPYTAYSTIFKHESHALTTEDKPRLRKNNSSDSLVSVFGLCCFCRFRFVSPWIFGISKLVIQSDFKKSVCGLGLRCCYAVSHAAAVHRA